MCVCGGGGGDASVCLGIEFVVVNLMFLYLHFLKHTDVFYDKLEMC